MNQKQFRVFISSKIQLLQLILQLSETLTQSGMENGQTGI